MPKTVGIKLRNSQRIQRLNSAGFVLKKGDSIIVMTEEGPEMGEVIFEPREMANTPLNAPDMEVLRLPLEEEMEKHKQNLALEAEVYAFCERKIKETNLPMCLVSVERLFDESKVVVSFTAEGRVDFRELLKALVSRFNTKIEMRQIGVRQEAKMKGGLGPCGRPLCCSSFLNDFVPVTIKMAKIQNISLNPGKISGLCGRLMCCLTFEHEYYEKTKKNFPGMGNLVKTEQGIGKVVRQNALKDMVTVMLESGDLVEIRNKDILEKNLPKNHGRSKRQKGKGDKS